jgi:hypothetical protein
MVLSLTWVVMPCPVGPAARRSAATIRFLD